MLTKYRRNRSSRDIANCPMRIKRWTHLRLGDSQGSATAEDPELIGQLIRGLTAGESWGSGISVKDSCNVRGGKLIDDVSGILRTAHSGQYWIDCRTLSRQSLLDKDRCSGEWVFEGCMAATPASNC